MAHRTINWITRFLSHLSSKIAPIKSDNPSAALESLERWSAFATIAIFIGIAFEAWATIHFQKSDETNWEVAAKLFADFCIGSGLLVEVVCILRTIVESRREKAESDSKVAEAYERVAQLEFESGYTQERIAMATERGAQADLARVKLEAQLQPRSLNKEQWDIIQGLRGKLEQINVAFETDAETRWFANSIMMAIMAAGIKVALLPRAADVHSFGILIYEPKGFDGARPRSVEPLIEMFRKSEPLPPLGIIGQVPTDVLMQSMEPSPTGPTTSVLANPLIIVGSRFLLPPANWPKPQKSA